MEKYTNFRDKGTGIAPFLPPPGDNTLFPASALPWNLLLLAVLLLKLALALPLLAAGLALPQAHTLALRTLLWGRLRLDYQVAGVKRSALRRGGAAHQLQPGTLYAANFSSALLAVALPLLAARPVRFLVPDAGTYYALTPGQLAAYTMAGRSLDPARFGTAVETVALGGSVVWVLLPEGTCSNGKSVLPFQTDRAGLQALLGEGDGEVKATLTPLAVRVGTALTTPLGGSRWRLAARVLLSHSGAGTVRVRRGEPVALGGEDAALDGVRAALNGGEKHRLVARTLGPAQKRAFLRASGRA